MSRKTKKDTRDRLGYHIEWRRKYPERYLLSNARKRAEKKGIPFDIDENDIIIPDRCPVFGVELCYGSRNYHGSAPSLERIDPTKGYVKGNIAVISHRANNLKGDATIEELQAIISWLRKVKK